MADGRSVFLTGMGIHPFGRHDHATLLDMAVTAISGALETSSVGLRDVEEVFVANALGASGTVAGLAEDLGIATVPVTRIEQACASGSTALRLACEAVTTGRRDTVLVIGVEKMGGGLLELDTTPSYEARLGLDLFPLLYGLKSAQYLHVSGATVEDLASIAAKARTLGSRAPHAATERPATVDEVLASPMIADPVTRLQCCRNADGAAAAIVRSTPGGRGTLAVAGWIGGIGLEDTAAPMSGGWDSRERIVAELSKRLYAATGVGPEDVELVQLNDAFAVAEPLYLEALGFAGAGDGVLLHREGSTGPCGRLPTNTDGGLIGRGHCLGATGLAMLYELWLQMSGSAGSRQVDRQPKTGLLQSHGYGGENLFILKH